MSDLPAALSRLAQTLEARIAELHCQVIAHVYVRPKGLHLEVKIHELDQVRAWNMWTTWEFIRDDHERAVDHMLANFEAKVAQILEQENYIG